VLLKRPAYVAHDGHVLVFGTTQVIGHHTQGNGRPDIIAPSFSQLLAVLGRQAAGLGVFNHPELYAVKGSFNGFAAPPNPRAIHQMVACELSSHTPEKPGGHKGPGLPSEGVRASNEAGWRLLLRRGWQLAPFGSTDRHAYPYKPGPYTVAFVDRRRIESLYQAFRARRTCYSEDRRSAIALAGWQDGRTDQPFLMGDHVAFKGSSVWVAAQVTGAVQPTRIRLEVISQDERGDLSIASHPLAQGEQHFGTEFSPNDLRARGAVAIYAKAYLGNEDDGAQLVTAPVFLHN